MAILCEGQLDTIAFHRAGFECAVAPLGTAFTPEQARILKRYTNRIALAFDADGAGQKAVLRAAEILLPLSMELRVIRIPGGKDPDELFAAGGAEAVAAAVDSSVSWLDVVIDSLDRKFRMDTPVGRGEAATFIANFLALVESRVELEHYVRQSASALRVSEEAVYAELSRLRRREMRRDAFRGNLQPENHGSAGAIVQSVPQEDVSPALSTLLSLAINYEDAARLMGEILPPEDIPENGVVSKAINCAINAALNGEFADLSRQLGEILLETPSPAVSAAMVEHTEYIDPERAVRDSIAELQRTKRTASRSELMQKLKNASSDAEKSAILLEIQKLNKK
jgi:DNA primase